MKKWIYATTIAFRREFRMVIRDVGVMLFFFVLPLGYPLVYSLIYNPEVTEDLPVAVVDECRSAHSREFVRYAATHRRCRKRSDGGKRRNVSL